MFQKETYTYFCSFFRWEKQPFNSALCALEDPLTYKCAVFQRERTHCINEIPSFTRAFQRNYTIQKPQTVSTTSRAKWQPTLLKSFIVRKPLENYLNLRDEWDRYERQQAGESQCTLSIFVLNVWKETLVCILCQLCVRRTLQQKPKWFIAGWNIVENSAGNSMAQSVVKVHCFHPWFVICCLFRRDALAYIALIIQGLAIGRNQDMHILCS